MKSKIETVTRCCAALVALLGTGSAEASGFLWESKGTNGVELMDPAVVLSNAVNVVRAASNSVEWSVATRARIEGFISAVKREAPTCVAVERLEGIRDAPEDYAPSVAVETTNAWLAAILSSHKEPSVRRWVIEYFQGATTRMRVHLKVEETTGRKVRNEDIVGGKYDHPWVKEITLPILKAAMFDDDGGVRAMAVFEYCRLAPRGIDEVIVWATKNPTHPCAMNMWGVMYATGLGDFIPSEIRLRIQEGVDRTKAEERRLLREAYERTEMARKAATATNSATGLGQGKARVDP